MTLEVFAKSRTGLIDNGSLKNPVANFSYLCGRFYKLLWEVKDIKFYRIINYKKTCAGIHSPGHETLIKSIHKNCPARITLERIAFLFDEVLNQTVIKILHGSRISTLKVVFQTFNAE